MKNVPHWQWLMVVYFIAVAIPVYAVHTYLKNKLLLSKTAINLLIYFVAVLATACTMNFIVMWVYYGYFFHK
jgi:hypothetical protein